MSDLSQSASDFEQIYRERFADTLAYRREIWKELTARFFAARVPPESVVLDLGCGYCEFINQIVAHKKYGMDLNAEGAGHAAMDVTIIQQDCSDPWPLDDCSVDVVFTSNLLEHLPTKAHLEKTLRQVRRVLKQEGVIIAMGPNIKYVPGAYWDFFDHHLALTEASVSEVLKKCGFVMQEVRGRFLPYTMSQRKAYPVWILRAYLMVPLCWHLFGKQFLVVARKR